MPKKITNTIAPPAAVRTADTRQEGFMLSWCLRQILTLPSECPARSHLKASYTDAFDNVAAEI